MPTKTYTNKDAERQYGKNIPDEIGEWRVVGGQTAPDPLASLGADPLQEAKDYLARTSYHDLANISSKRLQAETPDYTTSDVVKDALMAGAIPASFLAGPVGMVAGGALALQGLNSAIEDPSLTNVGTAALGALPFARPIGRAMERGRTAKRIADIRKTEGAGDMGAAFSRERPYRAGSGTSDPGDAIGEMGGAPATMMQKARSSVSQFLDKLKSTKAPAAPAAPQRFRAMEEMSHPGAQRYMEREFAANNPIFTKMAEQGTFGQVPKGEALAKRGRFNRQTPEVVERGPNMVGQVAPGAEDVEALTRGMLRPAVATPQSPAMAGLDDAVMRPGQRPSAEFVHAPDTSGAAFGFEELPEISEGELSRLQALFKRLGR